MQKEETNQAKGIKLVSLREFCHMQRDTFRSGPDAVHLGLDISRGDYYRCLRRI